MRRNPPTGDLALKIQTVRCAGRRGAPEPRAHRAAAMEFFEGKRVRELRGTFEDALDKTLEPQTLEVRARTAPSGRRFSSRMVVRGGRNFLPRPVGRARGRTRPVVLRPPPRPPSLTFPLFFHVRAQEFSAALSGLDAELHEPLHDLYCQLLQGINTFSLDEFEAIVREEALVPRLNALDQACEARGIMELGARADGGVAPLARPPDAVMRALRADVKKRELAATRTKLEDAERRAAEARTELHEASGRARAMAAGLRAGAAELQGVHESAVRWANRAPVFPAGAGAGPAAAEVGEMK